MSRHSRPRLLALAAVTALTLGLGACAAPGSDSGSTSGDSDGPIKLAVADAQSGQLSALGAWELKGAQLAVEEWNADGGVDGRKIEIEVFDTQGDPTTGTSIARKISGAGFSAMIGTAESAVTIAMAPVLQQAKIPNITSGQSPAISETKSPFVFLNGPTSVTYDEELAKYLVDEQGKKSFAMVTNNGGYGKGEHDAFAAALADRDLEPVSDKVVTVEQKDFSSILTSIRAQDPEVLFIGAEEVQAGLIAKQARELGLNAQIAGAAPLTTTPYVDTAGTKNAEGTIVSSPYLTNDANDATKKFAAAYEKKFGEVAELHGAKSYDGTNIVLKALEKTGGEGGQALADAIRDEPYDGLLGSFEFDDSGIGITKTSIGVIKNGQLETVER